MEDELTDRLSKFLSKIIVDNSDLFMLGKVYKHYVDTNPNYKEDRNVVYYLVSKVIFPFIGDTIREYSHFHYNCDGEYDSVKQIYTRRILFKFYNNDDAKSFKDLEQKYDFASW